MRDEVWALPGKQVVEGVRWAVCRRVSAGGQSGSAAQARAAGGGGHPSLVLS